MGGGGTGQPVARRRGALVGVLVVLALVPAYGWPWLSAWWMYPSPPPDVFRAAVQARAGAQRFVTAFDGAGRAHQVPAGTITDATPDRCTRWYRPDDRGNGGRSLPFRGGMADFTCLAGIAATGQAPVQAVVLLRLYTRPGDDAPPSADILPDGPYARGLLAELRP